MSFQGKDCIQIKTISSARPEFGAPELDADFAAWEDQFQTIRIAESDDGTAMCCPVTAGAPLVFQEVGAEDQQPKTRFVDPLATMDVLTSHMKPTTALMVGKKEEQGGAGGHAAGSMYPPSESSDTESDDDDDGESPGHAPSAPLTSSSSVSSFEMDSDQGRKKRQDQTRQHPPKASSCLVDPEDQEAFDEFTNIALVEPTEEGAQGGGPSGMQRYKAQAEELECEDDAACSTRDGPRDGKALEVTSAGPEDVAATTDFSVDHLMSCDMATLQKVSASLSAGMQQTKTNASSASGPTTEEAVAAPSGGMEIVLTQERRENRDRIKKMTKGEKADYMTGNMKQEEHRMLVNQAESLARGAGSKDSGAWSAPFDAAPPPSACCSTAPVSFVSPSVRERLQSIPKHSQFEKWLDGGDTSKTSTSGEGDEGASGEGDEGASGSRRLDFESALAETLAKYQ